MHHACQQEHITQQRKESIKYTIIMILCSMRKYFQSGKLFSYLAQSLVQYQVIFQTEPARWLEVKPCTSAITVQTVARYVLMQAFYG